jgi:hypothetical protein
MQQVENQQIPDDSSPNQTFTLEGLISALVGHYF